MPEPSETAEATETASDCSKRDNAAWAKVCL